MESNISKSLLRSYFLDFSSCADISRSFWTLTGSPTLLKHPALLTFAQSKRCTPAQAVYLLAQLNGVTPLSGTTDEEHMKHDIEVERIDISNEDQQSLGTLVKWMGLEKS